MVSNDPTMVRAREHLVPIMFCPARRGPMLSQPNNDPNSSPPSIRTMVGSSGDYAANAGTSSSPNTTNPVGGDGPFPINNTGSDPGRWGLTLTDITDGTSNTFAMSELTFRYKTGVGFGSPWAYRCWVSQGIDPAGLPVNTWGPTTAPVAGQHDYWQRVGSLHTGGANFLMGDGSVTFVSQGTPTSLLSRLSTIAGGEVAQLP